MDMIRSPVRVGRSVPSEGTLRTLSSPVPSRSEINVEVPPPSQLITLTHPISTMAFAVSYMVKPMEVGTLRPSFTSITSVPSAFSPMAVRGARPT